MPQEVWLSIVIGVSGVVAIGLTTLVVHILRAPASGASTSNESSQTSRPARSTAERPRQGGLLQAVSRTRRQRSVEGNFERAFARIDAVDPFVAQRRIGDALAEVGLVSSSAVFDDPSPPPQDQRSFGEVSGPSHRWENEA